MTLNRDKLLNYPIPDVKQKYSRQEMAFYALSIGMGMNPMDSEQLNYTDANLDSFQALPAAVLILGHAGFWLADPDTGVDAVRLVHGEQGIEWFNPLPAEGEIIGRSKVTDVIDKGEGKGALLYSEKELIDVKTDTLIAKTVSTTFLRANGGFGGPTGPIKEPHPLPESKPDYAVDLSTRPEQALYYRLNGDDNPLHSRPDIAEKAGFPRPILHGLCTMGVVYHALLSQFILPDNKQSKAIQLRFSAPVFPGETIRVEMWKDGSFQAHVLERDALVINNGLFTTR